MKHLNKSIKEFDRVARSQERKGVMKYGKALDPLDRYDWLNMVKEESVDGFKYLQAEIEKREFILNKIRKLTDNEEIHFWCDELEGNNGANKS